MDTIKVAGNGAGDLAVSEQVMEALLTELCVYAAKSCLATSTTATTDTGTDTAGNADKGVQEEEEAITVAAEMAAAKLERMGYATGYRLTERLAQNKTWNVAAAGQDPAAATAAQQLEAVKFLCKEVWMQVFNKQRFGIDVVDAVSGADGAVEGDGDSVFGLSVRYCAGLSRQSGHSVRRVV
jgi:hypothetical protein